MGRNSSKAPIDNFFFNVNVTQVFVVPHTSVLILRDSKEAGLIAFQNLKGSLICPGTDGYGLHPTQHLFKNLLFFSI